MVRNSDQYDNRGQAESIKKCERRDEDTKNLEVRDRLEPRVPLVEHVRGSWPPSISLVEDGEGGAEVARVTKTLKRASRQ